MEYDLPAGAQRLTQSSEGIAGAIVTGEVRLEDNQEEASPNDALHIWAVEAGKNPAAGPRVAGDAGGHVG